jgi:hypothetical protein
MPSLGMLSRLIGRNPSARFVAVLTMVEHFDSTLLTVRALHVEMNACSCCAPKDFLDQCAKAKSFVPLSVVLVTALGHEEVRSSC